MAAKTPVRLNFDGSGNLDGFAEFQSADFISLQMVELVHLMVL